VVGGRDQYKKPSHKYVTTCHVEPFGFAQDRLCETSPTISSSGNAGLNQKTNLRFFSRDCGIRMTESMASKRSALERDIMLH
jgi:hypothetical protein